MPNNETPEPLTREQLARLSSEDLSQLWLRLLDSRVCWHPEAYRTIRALVDHLKVYRDREATTEG